MIAQKSPSHGKEDSGPGRSEAVSDREILNVLRRHYPEKEWLTTTEITNKLPIQQDRTRGRLKQLRDEDRLRQNDERKTHEWALGPKEPTSPVDNVQRARAERLSQLARSVGRNLLDISAVFLALPTLVLVARTLRQAGYLETSIINHPFVIYLTGLSAFTGVGTLACAGVALLASFGITAYMEWHWNNGSK